MTSIFKLLLLKYECMNVLRVFVFSVLLLSLIGVGNVVAADVTADGDLRPGQSTTIDVTVTTTAEQSNVSVGLDLASSTGATLSKDSLSYGSVDGSATQTVQVTTPLSEKDSASLQLSYTSDSESKTNIVQLTNKGKEFFSVTDTTFNSPIGDPGYTEVSVENVSSEQYSNARVQFDTSKSPITIPEDQQTIYLGEVSKNEQKDFKVQTTVSDNVSSNSSYQLTSTLVFDTVSGSEVKEPLYIEIQPKEKQQITASVENSDVSVGGTGITEIELENTKEKDLSNVFVTLETMSSDVTVSESNSTDITVGDLDAGEKRNISVVTGFTDDAVEDVEYKITSTIEYDYDSSDLSNSESSTFTIQPTGTESDIVQVEDQNAPVGGSGTVSFKFTNSTDEDIEDIDLTVQSNNPKVSFDGNTKSTQSFSNLDSTNSITFTEDISFTESASASSNYSVTVTAEYEYENINKTITQDQSLLLTPLSEQNVDISLDNAISVTEGDEFDLPVKLTNTGPKDVEDIEFTITSRNDITVKRDTFAKSNLSVGETHTFNVPVDAPLDSETLQQEFDTSVTYEASDASQSVSEVLQLQLNELESEFSVRTNTESTVSTGSSEVITIQVTNQLDKPVSNVDAEFSASSPLSVVDSSAYLSKIESGETVNLNVNVEADSGATPNPYPLDLDFQYDNSKGNAQLSEVYSVQVNVSESENQLPIIPGIIILIIVLSGGFGYYYRNTIRSIIQ